MPSLLELVQQVNGGDAVEAADFSVYQGSANAAERFLSHHAGATLGLRSCHAHLYEALAAVDFADRKVLEQYAGLCGFLGLDELRTGPTVSFGRTAIARGEVALGLEAIAAAVAVDLSRGWAWSNDRGNLEDVCEQYDAAARAIGWSRGTPAGNGGGPTRIAYVVSSLADDEPGARAAAALAKNLDDKKFRLSVYSTEAWCRRDKQQFADAATFAAGGSHKRGQGTISRLAASNAGHWVAPTTGDCATAAVALAEQLADDKADVLLLDVDPSDPIAGVVSRWPVARSTLYLARRVPLYGPGIDAVAYLDPARCEADRQWWDDRGGTATSLVEGVDLDAPVGEAPRRSVYGLPDAATILTTAADDVARTVTPRLVDGIIAALKANPQAVYLLVGGGDAAAIRKRFDAAGVGKRVGYAGKRRDLPGFLKMADIYVAEFPDASPAGVLQAMSMGLATVATQCDDSATGIVACEFVGSEGTVGDTAEFVERVGRLVRDGAYRQQHGRQMRRRVEQHFSYEQTARGIESLVRDLLAGEVTLGEPAATADEPLPKAA